jgi:sulfoxide reductase catalytic subunit YedY
MANLIRPPGWQLPEKKATPESVFLNRRRFLRRAGLAGGAFVSATITGWSRAGMQAIAAGARAAGDPTKPGTSPKSYPAKRNSEFNPDWRLTKEAKAANWNNFYEFSTDKERVAKVVDKFVVSPWPIEIGGLVEKPLTLDVQELVDMMTIEERVYRFRCVEAWSMVVPWTGFPLSKLIEKVSPKSSAKFVRFETFNRPEQAPGIKRLTDYPWPYIEGLRMDEAMNPLTLVATGIYGKPLPKQHGAPARIVVPWKYGYKGAKSIVKIEFVEEQPKTFWETIAPKEYPFESNVDPAVPHPRWSQATEEILDTGERVPTQKFNGYGKYVADLYKKG